MNCKKSSLTALPFSLDFMDKEVKDVTDSKLKKNFFVPQNTTKRQRNLNINIAQDWTNTPNY